MTQLHAKDSMARLLTYNVHRCVGVDRRLDVDRIVAVIAEHEPDIVCLQELDVGRARTGFTDQAGLIAEKLAMTHHFHPAMQVEAELYGDAILTHHPERLVKSAALPTLKGIPGLEPRGALWSAIEIEGVALNGRGWLGHPECTGPTILTGDFNVTSLTRPYQALARRLPDVQRTLGLKPTIKTFPSSFPAVRIDHCFASPEIVVRSITAPFSPLARMASDHLPLVVDFEIRTDAARDPTP